MTGQGKAETLEALWHIAEKEGQRVSMDPLYVFEQLGLILCRPLTNAGYDLTPVNTSTFAYTGGDGVHYGLLHLNNEASEESPIVMTVPSCFDSPNLIVGEDLKEFLCLGCQVGYANLEQLVYLRQQAITWIKHPEQGLVLTGDFETCYVLEPVLKIEYPLDVLTRELKLRPWDNVQQRLEQLQQQYLPLLQLR